MLIDLTDNLLFEYNDFIQNPLNYIKTDPKLNDFTLELLYIMSKKETMYKDDQLKYLFALSLIPIKLLLRMELRLLKTNKDANEESRIEEITNMLEDESKISLFSEQKVDKKEEKKLMVITNYHIKKKKEQIKQNLLQGKKENKRRRQLENFLLNEVECTQLSEQLKEVENETEFEKDNENKTNDNQEEDEKMEEIIDEVEKGISDIQMLDYETENDFGINNNSNEESYHVKEAEKKDKTKKRKQSKPAERKIKIIKGRKNKKSIITRLKELSSK